ncbi:Protein phosphatase methylesterase 1 [Mycoemilia scoparia]|uniref:Protein phosphatase methylesterase 1 n=1 Tax=Mycoemilia scoparia TaxID=417184 RepID=A0A9W8A518_9FUNG|nr:Protein phosphatase methylesterase 1 [Mycoemilia scoparia]
MNMRKMIFKSSISEGREIPTDASNTDFDSTDFEPLPWDKYFDTVVDTKIDSSTFIRSYIIGQGASSGPIFICHHGAGNSGLSFGVMASSLAKNYPKGGFTIVAYDCRGHGGSQTANDANLSLNILSDDLINLFNKLFPDNKRDVYLIGHSMGGGVVSKVAADRRIPSVSGLAIIDVVEGSAIESLAFMQGYIHTRPQEFDSIPKAIEWHLKSGTIKNQESAKLSVPSFLKKSSNNEGVRYQWAVDLEQTSPFWEEWYRGMSSRFLNTPAGKLLILAGTDRLDKELMIGQMQGK